MGLQQIGTTLIAIGLLLVVVGIALVVAPSIPFLGRLPGDILIKRDGFTFYFPIVTSILLSALLSLLLWVLSRFR